MRYPGKCRSIAPTESSERAEAGEPFVVRFKSDKRFSFVDAVYGRYEKGEDEEDFVIIKSDGFPTYHFANVVDDALMRITHVVRGDEWLISTPKHIALYDALDLRPPVFAHLGLLVGPGGEKLSKRSGDISVRSFRDRGYDSVVLLNWLALHGSRMKPGVLTSSEMVPSLATLVDAFSYQFTKGAISPNYGKLEHIHTAYVSRIRSVPDGWTQATRNMSLPVLKMIRRVEEMRNADKPRPGKFDFYDNEGNLSGSIDLDYLGPLMPAIADGLLDPSAYDVHFPIRTELTQTHQVAALKPGNRARYTATALIMHGPLRNAVPTHVVLSASNLIWRPTRAKLTDSFKTLRRAETQVGIAYSPVTFWERLLEAVEADKDPTVTVAAEIVAVMNELGDGGVADKKKTKGQVVALLHSWVRQALVGSHDENSPATGHMFALLGPAEAASRLRAAIVIGTELGWRLRGSIAEQPAPWGRSPGTESWKNRMKA